MNPLTITVTFNPEAIAGAEETILAGVVRGMERIGERGVGLVVAGTPVGATGNLAHSVFPHLEQNADLISEIITNGPPADVYSSPVNDGSRPHFPPYEALIPWVIAKFGATDEKTARSIAFLIARKIARQGTLPAHQYDKAWEQLLGEAQGILESAIGESLKGAGY
jgi:hypothetical protein